MVTLVILILAGIGVYFYRKRSIQKRQKRRSTWNANLFPAIEYKDEKSIDNAPPVPDKSEMVQRSPSTLRYQLPSRQSGTASPTSPSIHVSLAPPPASYNNPVAANALTGHTRSTAASTVNGSMADTTNANDMAVVKCVFIPSLPDELSITGGEIVRVINAYDDGWAFCENARGEQGMIPLECLGRNAQTSDAHGFREQETNVSAWRNSKRVSSLHVGSGMNRF